MKRFEALAKLFLQRFEVAHFPASPATLYEPADYFLSLGGKRIRPVLCLLGNELFGEIQEDAWRLATAIELFHNFTLIHDDIMDKAPVRRGRPTLHTRYNESSALLAGDVMLVKAYDYINSVETVHIREIIRLFNKTGTEVCEGQQLDMDFEKATDVSLKDYLYMIERKTAVLLAAALRMGAIVAGAPVEDQHHLYAFGKNLGLAFQVQDDYLDAFGDPEKFGKQPGGDILSNKKTFLLIQALETAAAGQRKTIVSLLNSNAPDKIEKMINLFKQCKVDEAAMSCQQQYISAASKELESIRVPDLRKESLKALASYLLQRQF